MTLCDWSTAGEVISQYVLMFVYRHVMNELLETERAYVEELLCVLQVSAAVYESNIFGQIQSSFST